MTAVPDWTQEPGAQEAFAAADARRIFDPEALAAAVHQLAAAADAVNVAALGSEDLPWTDLAAFLDTIREARKMVQAVESNLEVRTAKAMGAAEVKRSELDGVGFVEWHRGRSRKTWAHDAVARDVVDTHMRLLEGEVVDPWTIRDWLLEAAHVDYWRTTALKALGLDPEDYSTSIPGKLSVEVTRPG